MNFFKRKFSFQDDEGGGTPLEDPMSSSVTGPPSAFSFQAITNKVSSTISAPTSPARTNETLAAALEKSLYQQENQRTTPAMHPDTRILLVIDSHSVDWSKYFRNCTEPPIRVEQADFPELDLMCTEHSCTVEINQQGRDPRSFCPHAAFIAAGASKCSQGKTVIRSLIAAGIPFLNSHSSMVAFLDKNNLKKQLRKISLPDGGRIPFLPTIHYPHFRKFHPSTSFPVVVSVNEGYQGIGKIRVNNHEELMDLEGMIQMMARGDTEVELEPYVDLKYDLHVQKIGSEYKTFLRRSIGKNWKSNVGAAVLEQIPSIDRHKQYLKAISDHVGRMNACSIDILISKEGREFVHDIKDVLAYYGESAEDDRRAVSLLLRDMIGHRKKRTTHQSSVESPRDPREPQEAKDPRQQTRPAPPNQNGYHSNGHNGQVQSPQTPNQHHPLPRHKSIERPSHHPMPNPMPQSPMEGQHQRLREQSRDNSREFAAAPSHQQSNGTSATTGNYVEDTMGQLKRTFAGIFGEVALQPYVDLKYDLHVQKIGNEYKTFLRRTIQFSDRFFRTYFIGKNWKSNVGAAVLEQIPSIDRHKQYLKATSDHVGRMNACSIDILISKEGREFVHDIKDVLAYYGESAEDDRRAVSLLLRDMIGHRKKRTTHQSSVESPRDPREPQEAKDQRQQTRSAPPNQNGYHSNAHNGQVQSPQTPNQHHLPRHKSIERPSHHPMPNPMPQSPMEGQHQRIREQSRDNSREFAAAPSHQQSNGTSATTGNYVEDTMGQLKRTFAGIFGDVS